MEATHQKTTLSNGRNDEISVPCDMKYNMNIAHISIIYWKTQDGPSG